MRSIIIISSIEVREAYSNLVAENDSEYEVLYLIKVLLRFLVFWEIVDKSSS